MHRMKAMKPPPADTGAGRLSPALPLPQLPFNEAPAPNDPIAL